ncbi:MAG TPA: pyruvate dehydrogenase (acetyl-transferring) E1 component subunit alpha [Ktedonobacterales bacterium]|nr:pyruvate dehydrogenase (acetyl-transferring) E1 component subunit alpha [Ktedonobacterales bacterium]
MAKATSTRQAPGPGAIDNPVAGLLTAEGTLTEEGERVAAVSDETLRALYRWMVIARRLDQEGLNLQRQGELGLWGPIQGHEASQVAGALAMRDSDWIFPYYRDFAMAVVRGIDPGEILTVFRGLRHGAWNPQEYRFGPFVIPVGTQVPHAVGYALGCKLDGEGTVTLTCFGEGATSTGDWHEAMNFAGVFQAPVVFLCQNNQWAISVPIEEQVAGRIVDRAAGYGMPGVRVDGSDALTIYAAVKMASDHARAGKGPYLIEAYSYRLGPHTTSDDPTRYRTEEETAEWRARDPIARAAERLRARGAWDDEFARACETEAEERASAMRQTLVAAAPEHPGKVFDLVFANQPESLRRERDTFVAELAPDAGTEGH